MNPNEIPQQPTENEPMPVIPEGNGPVEKSTLGPAIGTVIIVVILIIGAFYFWSTGFKGDAVEDATTAELQRVGSTDNLSEIEADLENSNFDDLDSDFNSLESDLQ